MANAFSVAADFGDYIQPINTELVNFVLSSKQQKYDYNVAKIDETIAEFGLDLERQKDKDYVLQQLNGVLDSVNSMGKMDLSSGNVTRQIQQQIRGAMDDKMVQAAASTKNYRNFIGSLQAIKSKDPDKYSDINAAFAMERGGVNAWLNEETDSLGSVQYTPYQDVNAKVTKNIKDLKQFSPERSIEIPFQDPATGARRIIKKKVKDLNEAEIRSFVMSNLDANSQNQLKINGWASFNGVPDNELIDYTKTYRTQRVKNYDNDINLLREQLKTAPAYMAEDLANRIQVLQSEKNSFNNTMDNIGTDRDNIGRVIMQEQLVDDVTRAYADTTISFELKDDAAYYKNAKLELDKALALFKMSEKKQSSTGSGATGGLANPQVRQVEGTAVHEEDFDPEQRTNDIIKEQEAKANSIAQGIVTNMSESNKQLFNSMKEKNPSLSDAEVLQEMNIDPIYTDDNGDERLFSQVMNDLKDTFEDATESYRQTMEESFEGNIDDVYREITSEGVFNNNEFPLILEDGSLVQMDEFLKQQGVTLEDFKENVNGIKDKVKKSLYLNKALNVATGSITADSAGRRNATTSEKHYLLSPSDFHAMDNYIKAMDSNDDIFNYVDFVDPDSNEVLKKEDVDKIGDALLIGNQESFRIVPKTQTSKALFGFFEQRQGIGTDAKVSSEGRLNEIISFDTSEFKRKLTDNFAAHSSRNLVIDPNLGKGGKELNDVHVRMRNFLNSKGLQEIDNKLPFVVQESLFNPNEVLVFQNKEDAQPLSVSKNELGQFLQIDLTQTRGQEVTINTEIINRDIAPLNLTKAAHQDKQRVVGSMIARGEVLGGSSMSKKGLTDAFRLEPAYGDTQGNKTEAGLLIDRIIGSEFDNVSVSYKPRSSGGYVTVMNKSTQEEIVSYPVEQPQVNLFRNTVRYNPQLFMAQAMQDMLNSFRTEQTNSELYRKLLQTQRQDGATN